MKEALKQFLRALIVMIDGKTQITEDHRLMAIAIGKCFAQQEAAVKMSEDRCNHKKAGMIRITSSRLSIRNGLNNGNSSQYAVRKHQMMNGDIWVDCLRCGKKWRPPVAQKFSWFERKFRTQRFQDHIAALVEYDRAVNFETNNVMSSSLQCRFTDPKTGQDAGKQVRAMYAALGD